MKLGTVIIDLHTGRRGPLVSVHPRCPGVWVFLEKRRVYVRNWALACHWRKPKPINPDLLKLAMGKP